MGPITKSLTVARHEFLKTAKRKGFIITALLLPLIVSLPFILSVTYAPSFDFDSEEETIGYIDNSGILKSSESFKEYDSIESAKEAFVEGTVSSFFVIPENYIDDGKVRIYSESGFISSESSESRIEDFLKMNLLSFAGVDEKIAEKIINPLTAEKITLDENGNVDKEEQNIVALFLPYALSILLVLGILTSSGYLMEGIGEEKESRTGELLLSSISAEQLLTGKIIGYGSVGLLQISIWILFGMIALLIIPVSDLITGTGSSWIFVLAVIYFILGFFLFSVSIACTASISSTTKEAQQISSIFTIFAIVPLFLSQFIITSPDSLFAQILTYFPYTSPFITMMRLPLVDVSWMEIATSIVILVISIGVITKLAAKIFRIGMLVYGKRPGFRDIFRYLKEE